MRIDGSLALAWLYKFMSVTAVLCFGQLGHANPVPLQILVRPPSEGARALNMELYTFQLSGEIDRGAASRLENEIKAITAKDGHLSFYLNSPGGNLAEGIKIGQLIRRYGISTTIGVYGSDKDLSGSCFSACALAFLGGPYRYMSEGSIFGVHRFSASPPCQNDVHHLPLTI